MSILVADSGGTKTDWAIIEDGKFQLVTGPGVHPAYLTSDQIKAQIETVGKKVNDIPSHIHFYGAGCHGLEPSSKIENALMDVFPTAEVDVKDDLTGAARAHLQRSDGIITIFGTGSICGRYESGEISKRSASLGFAIGDEGSAADLGRMIVKAYFRESIDDESFRLVEERLEHTSYSKMMEQIYSSKRPNIQLAKIAGDIFKSPLTLQLKEIVAIRFAEFINSQMAMLLPESKDKIICTGAVAAAHADILETVMADKGFQNVSTLINVIEGLVRYHSPLKQSDIAS